MLVRYALRLKPPRVPQWSGSNADRVEWPPAFFRLSLGSDAAAQSVGAERGVLGPYISDGRLRWRWFAVQEVTSVASRPPKREFPIQLLPNREFSDSRRGSAVEAEFHFAGLWAYESIALSNCSCSIAAVA